MLTATGNIFFLRDVHMANKNPIQEAPGSCWLAMGSGCIASASLDTQACHLQDCANASDERSYRLQAVRFLYIYIAASDLRFSIIVSTYTHPCFHCQTSRN